MSRDAYNKDTFLFTPVDNGEPYEATYPRPPIRMNSMFAPLFDKPRWVPWAKATKSTKLGKVPLNAHRNNHKDDPAVANNPEAWGTLEQATHRYRLGIGFIDGIGLALVREDSLAFLDVDPQKPGFPEGAGPMLWNTIKAKNLYAEKSPGGQGVHIPIMLKGFRYDQIDMFDNAISIMNARCFITMTGAVIHGGEIQDGWPLVRALMKHAQDADSIKYHRGNEAHSRVIEAMATDKELEWAVKKMERSRQGAKFMKLFAFRDNEFMTSMYPSQSMGGQLSDQRQLEEKIKKEADITWRRFSAWNALVSILVDQSIPDHVIKKVCNNSWMMCDNKFNEMRAEDPVAYFIDHDHRKTKDKIRHYKKILGLFGEGG